jgi:hypothetical protein
MIESSVGGVVGGFGEQAHRPRPVAHCGVCTADDFLPEGTKNARRLGDRRGGRLRGVSQDSPGWRDEIVLLDSTAVECGRSL